MGKKKIANAPLIAAIAPPETIPYEPQLAEETLKAADRHWQKLELVRGEAYRRVTPTVWLELLEAETMENAEHVKAIELKADRQWQELMGVPAITSWPNLEIVMATVEAAGYPPTNAGLYAWAIAKRNTLDDRPPDFVPNVFQRKILKALEGRALNKAQLAAAVCGGEGSRLYRKDGIKELIADGKVARKTRLGYYRPDAPPPLC